MLVEVWNVVPSFIGNCPQGAYLYGCCSVSELSPTLCDPMDSSTPGPSVLDVMVCHQTWEWKDRTETNTPGIQRKQRSGGDRITGNNFGKDEGLEGTHPCFPSTWHVLVELNWTPESGCPGEHCGLMWAEAGQKGILEQASGIYWGERGCPE